MTVKEFLKKLYRGEGELMYVTIDSPDYGIAEFKRVNTNDDLPKKWRNLEVENGGVVMSGDSVMIYVRPVDKRYVDKYDFAKKAVNVLKKGYVFVRDHADGTIRRKDLIMPTFEKSKVNDSFFIDSSIGERFYPADYGFSWALSAGEFYGSERIGNSDRRKYAKAATAHARAIGKRGLGKRRLGK